MSVVKFIMLRYFIVPDQDSLFYQGKPDEDKREIFASAVFRNQKFVGKRNVTISILGVSWSDELVMGKLGRERVAVLASKTQDDIKDVKIRHWPYLRFVGSPAEQLLVFEWKSRPGFTIESLCRILSELATDGMFEYGYVVHFEPLVHKEAFWNIVRQRKVCMVRFTLNAPNLFEAHQAAEQSLKKLNDMFNNIETTVTLSNPGGTLRIPEENLGSYVEYCNRGGGQWELETTHEGRRHKHKSTHSPICITIDASDMTDDVMLRLAVKKAVDAEWEIRNVSD